MKLNIPLLLLALLLVACNGTQDEAIVVPATTAPTAETVTTDAPSAEPTNTTEASESDDTLTDSVDLTLFFDGALTEEAAIVDCTLTDGTQTMCYEITVVGTPVNHDVGPFCPTSITDSADAGGLWLDGENSYVIDGAFFTELADIYGDELWNNIYNDDGSVNVIDNAEDFQVAARPDITEEYYYHCVDGDVAWVGDGVQPTTTIQVPVTPVLTDALTTEFAEGAHSNLGVTLNGAVLAGSADMSAILASYTIAAFDDCGGHINPALGYHVHGTAGCSDVGDATDGETAPFALALDGHTIHAPYDAGVDVELDECNGHTSEQYGYHYHANSLEENATLTCLKGLTVEGQAGGPAGGGPGGGPGGGGPGGQGGGATDFAAAAATLGISEDDLRAALGGPPPDIEAAATELSITVEALQEALGVDVQLPDDAAVPTDEPAAVETTAAVETNDSLDSNYLDSYTIDDTGFGTAVITVVDAAAQTRTVQANALPNHETGDFPNPGNPNAISEQDRQYVYTTEPTFTGVATPVRTTGVAINGVKLEPGTAERATCETGEVYAIEAIQDVTDLGLDFNNAHVQPTGEYHYHGVSDLLVEIYSLDQDLVHVAFAADGHLIYRSKSSAFQSSYRLGEDAREGTNCTYSPP